MGLSPTQLRAAISAFTAMIVSSPAVLAVNPLLLTPITDEFGWGRSTYTASYLIAAPVMAVMYLLVGPAVDRFGVKRVALPGIILFAGTLALLALMSGSVPQYLLLRGINSAAAAMVTGIAFGKVVSSQFTDNRGLYLGICLGLGGGLGMVIHPLIGAELLDAVGWRGTYLGIAAVTIAIGLPSILMLPREGRPAAYEQTPAGSAADGATNPLFRDTTCILLMVSTLVTFLVINGVAAHYPAIAGDIGLSPADGALALAVYAFAMMSGQFLIGPALDRLTTARIVSFAFLLLTLGILPLMLDGARFWLMVSALAVGAGGGAVAGTLPYVLPRFFGLGSFGTLYAWLHAAAAVGTGVGPYLMGFAFDQVGSYQSALIALTILSMSLAVLAFFMPAYRFRTDGRSPLPA